MTCEQLSESFELYALGLAESAEAAAIAEHLASGCPNCEAELKRAIAENEIISRTVPLVNPPARLRRRIQETFAPRPKRRFAVWSWALAAAASLVLVAGFVLVKQARNVNQELARTNAQEMARVSATLEILSAPGTRKVLFADAKVHGSLYVHQQLGMALVMDALPAAPAGWKYESWLVPKNGSPQPVQAFYPDAAGRALTVRSGPVDINVIAAMAVSLEPRDSIPTKPTKVVFAARI